MIYGHRHLVVDKRLGEETRLIVLGDWLSNFSYGVFDGRDFKIITGVDKIGDISAVKKSD